MISRSRSISSVSSRRGIALLVTIVLLSFLVLIMVALSSLVRVETKIANNQDTLAQARQNALTGLNIALGKLQETAGPDLRVTARADLLENSLAPEYQMNLTGVWDTSVGGAPTLVTWLVNGNEDLQGLAPHVAPDLGPLSGAQAANNQNALIFDVSDAAPGGAAAQKHHANEPLFNDEVPTARDMNPPGVAPNFYFGDGRVTLVGRGSVDLREESATIANFENGNSYKNAARERVIVRKSPIIIDGAKVPGKAATTNITIGNYAYWVGDAGIKASLAAANRAPDLDYDGSSGAGTGVDYQGGSDANEEDYINRQMLHSLQLQGSRLDLVFRPGLLNNNGYLPDIFEDGNVPEYLQDLGVLDVNRQNFYGALIHPATRDAYSRLFLADQIKDLLREGPLTNPTVSLPTADTTVDQFKTVIGTRLKQLYHDVTPQTFSVLTNMLTGGLRTDLSQVAGLNALPNALRPGITYYSDTVWRGAAAPSQPFADNTNQGLLQRRLTTTAGSQAAPTTTDAAYPIAPVLSELGLRASLALQSDGSVQVTLNGFVELWNPYNATLNVNTPEVQFTLVDSALTEITFTNDVPDPDPDPTQVVPNFSPAATFGNGPITLVLSAPPASLAAGQIGKYTITPQTFTARVATAPTTSAPLSIDPALYPVATTTLEVTTYGGATIDAVLRETGAANALSNYIGIVLGPGGAAGANEFFYEFRLIDWMNGTADTTWKTFDPRGPSLGAAETVAYAIGKLAPESSATGNDLYDSANRVILFDVPRQDILGVGSLRNVVLAPSANLYAVGSAASGADNNLFEQYFFSSVPRTKTTGWTPLSGAPLANGTTVIVDPTPNGSSSDNDLWDGTDTKLDGLLSEKAAQYMLVRDTLNVNSTSELAWRSLLGGLLPTLADPDDTTTRVGYTGQFGDGYLFGQPANVDPTRRYAMAAAWRFYNGATNRETSELLQNAYFRFPHTSSYVEGDYVTLRNNLSAAAGTRASPGNRELSAFRLGVRELTRTQVEELAWWVVERIKNPAPGQNRPFESVTQFINEGVLDYAIGRVGSAPPAGVTFPSRATEWNNDPINDPGRLGTDLPVGSPAYLSQGDILEQIGHRLFARSDTFVIRAYGDVTEPTTFDEAAGTAAPKVLSRVWVEATVQRMPMKHPTSYKFDENMEPTRDPGAATETGNYGRQFRIVNLRWLRPEEI